ncbi:MAG: sodium:proton antiporter, partial [Bacteroidales bacterium]|nr:sodium:proton antiporter [Bacteroidales bacterium]
ISICVAIILFDGGLNLNPGGYKKAPRIIMRLLTIGVLITWLGTAILINYLFHFPVSFSLLCGSLIIVTGPTVISPILRNYKIKEKLHHILHWESVLIDPIGVFIAILCFEWYIEAGMIVTHIWIFSLRVLIGIAIGITGGFFIYWLIQRKWVPDRQTNIFVFSSAILLFGLSDMFISDSGILTVVIAGFVLGWKKPDKLKKIREFKSEISELAIGILFILLAARLNLKDFINLGGNGLILIGCAIFIIRPLNIFLSSINTSLKFREGLFLSWIAPRGVVAASMASLFALKLHSSGNKNANFIEIFTFSIIIITVIFQGGTAGFLINLLKLKATRKKTWLIVGANEFSREIADILENNSNQKCYFIDANYDAVNETRIKGFDVFQGNALEEETLPEDIISGIDNVLALTDNKEINLKICEKWYSLLKKGNFFYWSQERLNELSTKKISCKAVWNNLAKPSEISYDIKQKNINLTINKVQYLQNHHTYKVFPLLFLNDDNVQIYSDEDEKNKNSQVLFLEYEK